MDDLAQTAVGAGREPRLHCLKPMLGAQPDDSRPGAPSDMGRRLCPHRLSAPLLAAKYLEQPMVSESGIAACHVAMTSTGALAKADTEEEEEVQSRRIEFRRSCGASLWASCARPSWV